MKLELTGKFEETLKSNPALKGALLTTLDKFSDWLSINKTEFFPEYADHVQSFLNTAESIISDQSLEDTQKVIIGDYICQYNARISQIIPSYRMATIKPRMIYEGI